MADNRDEELTETKIKEEYLQMFGVPTQNIDQAKELIQIHRNLFGEIGKNNAKGYMSHHACTSQHVTEVIDNNECKPKILDDNVVDNARKDIHIITKCAIQFADNCANTSDYTVNSSNIAMEEQLNVNISSKINLQYQLVELQNQLAKDHHLTEDDRPSATCGYENIKYDVQENVEPSTALNNLSNSNLLQEKQSDCAIRDNINPLQELSFMSTTFASNSLNMNFTNTNRPENTEQNPHACKFCIRKFSKLELLKRHVQGMHTDIKTHSCKYCNKTFAKSSNLKQHERLHTGEKPYLCEVCNNAFKRLDHLKEHERIHTGEKPYLCEVCNKAFTLLGTLKVHERIHTGEKPYVCEFCNKAFTQLGNLRQHERLHTGEKPYVCEFCNKAFTLLGNLRQHERTHTGENA